MNKASNESEEAAQSAEANIGLASSSSDESNQVASARSHAGANAPHKMTIVGSNQQQQNGSGHHDPKQRQIYLILLGFSVLNGLTGFGLILVWMFKYRAVTGIGLSNAGQLSNLHPVMMYLFMVSLNMYSVLVYRTHYSQPKERLKWAHAILSGLNIVMSLLGVLAMFKAHLMAEIPNFYSLHSWIGVLTNAFYLTQFVAGFVCFLKPGLGAQQRARLMPWHRFAGATLLVLAGLAAITGITELVIFQDKDGSYSRFTGITFIANLAGVCTILMTAVSIYLLTAPQYLRPRLAEEEPLKK